MQQLADKAKSPAGEDQPSLSDSANASIAVPESSIALDAYVEPDENITGRDAMSSRPLNAPQGGHTPVY